MSLARSSVLVFLVTKEMDAHVQTSMSAASANITVALIRCVITLLALIPARALTDFKVMAFHVKT